MSKTTKKQEQAISKLSGLLEQLGVEPDALTDAVEGKKEQPKKAKGKKSGNDLEVVSNNGHAEASNVFAATSIEELQAITSKMDVPVYLAIDANKRYIAIDKSTGAEKENKKVYNTATCHGWKAIDVTLPAGDVHELRFSLNAVMTRDPEGSAVKAGSVNLKSMSAEQKQALLEALINDAS